MDDQTTHECFAYETGDWNTPIPETEITLLIAECQGKQVTCIHNVTGVPLPALSTKSLITLTRLESLAFNQPMGESLVKRWKARANDLIFVAERNGAVGFLVLDLSFSHEGVFYIELTSAYPTGQGLGAILHETAMEYVKYASLPGKHKVVFGRTQNPAEAMSIRKALHAQGFTCFPIDRQTNQAEQTAISIWLNSAYIPLLRGRQPNVDLSNAIFIEAYKGWSQAIDLMNPTGIFLEYLTRAGIDLATFLEQGNAFLIGGEIC